MHTIYEYIKKGEKGRSAGKYVWPKPDDEKENMSDRKIVDKYVNLDRLYIPD